MAGWQAVAPAPATPIATLPNGRYRHGAFAAESTVFASHGYESAAIHNVINNGQAIIATYSIGGVAVAQWITEPVPAKAPIETAQGQFVFQAESSAQNIAVSNVPPGRIAYCAIGKKGKAELIVDGKPIALSGAASEASLSPDGTRWACINSAGNKAELIINAQATGSVQPVGPLVFSPDSKRIAFAGRTTGSGQLSLCVDGKLGSARFDAIERILWSPDSRRVAAVVRQSYVHPRIQGKQERYRVIVDDKPSQPYFDIHKSHLIFSNDSAHVAFRAHRADPAVENSSKYLVVLDGIEQKNYDYVFDGSLRFGPDNVLEYTAGNAAGSGLVIPTVPGEEVVIGRPLLVRGGTESPGWPFRAVYSPDGKHRAYITPVPPDFVEPEPDPNDRLRSSGFDLPGAKVLYVDGEVYCAAREWRDVDDVYFSPDSQHVAVVTASSSPLENDLLIDGTRVRLNQGGTIVAVRFVAPHHLKVVVTSDGRRSSSGWSGPFGIGPVRFVDVILRPISK